MTTQARTSIVNAMNAIPTSDGNFRTSERRWPHIWSSLLPSLTFRDNDHGTNTKRLFTDERVRARRMALASTMDNFGVVHALHATSGDRLPRPGLRLYEWRATTATTPWFRSIQFNSYQTARGVDLTIPQANFWSVSPSSGRLLWLPSEPNRLKRSVQLAEAGGDYQCGAAGRAAYEDHLSEWHRQETAFSSSRIQIRSDCFKRQLRTW
jgi:hypothetical protein